MLTPLALCGALLVAATPARAVPVNYVFTLVTSGSETTRSLVQAMDGANGNYPTNKTFNVTIDLAANTISLANLTIPSVSQIGLNMSFMNLPATITGTLSGSGSTRHVTFNNDSGNAAAGIQVGFDRDGASGTLTFNLTTTSTTIPAGCDERTMNQVINGAALDLTTGYLELVASVCPYNFTSPVAGSFDDAWRLFLRGTINIPEPGTLLLVAGGLVGLAASRRRAGRA